MKIVIDIQDDLYMGIKEDRFPRQVQKLYTAVKNSTPLPEKSQREQALELLLEWAIECDFGYDNLGEDLYEEYKDEIENFGYKEGLIYIAERELEKEKNNNNG